MKIELKINNNTYYITPDTGCYTIARLVTITKEDSPKFGQQEERDMGTYPTTLNKAVRTILRAEIAGNDEVVSLKAYADHVDKLWETVREQLIGYEL